MGIGDGYIPATDIASRDIAITNSYFYLFLKRDIYLDLPKFSVSSSYDVKSLFKKMGVTEVFSDQADLSGVAKNLLLKVSKVSMQTGMVNKRFFCLFCMQV